MSEPLLNITVTIADRPYRMKINPNEEEKVRTAAKEVNDKIKELQKTYRAVDRQDYLAMCALTFASDAIDNKKQVEEIDHLFIKKLSKLETKLTEAVK